MSVEVYGGGGGASLKLQSKIVTPSTEQQIVTPDSGMDGLSKVTVNAMPGGTLAAPTISESGVITSKIEKGGYLNTGDNRTLRLSTQAGKTVVPTKFSQTAVSKGLFTTGEVRVSGDGNLIPANIKKGVSIFGVLGNFVGDGDHKALFGTVDNNSISAYLSIPTPGEYIVKEKIKAIIFIISSGDPGTAQTPITIWWMYDAEFYTNQVFYADVSTGIGLTPQENYINSQYGYIQAGWESTVLHCFSNRQYHYIVVAEV